MDQSPLSLLCQVRNLPRYLDGSSQPQSRGLTKKAIPLLMGLPKVLIACEFSGRVRDEFLSLGCDAISCDLLPTESPGPHYQGDVTDILENGFDLLIAHPPCTYLCNAGVRHLHSIPSKNGVVAKIHGEQRWKLMRAAADFFNTLKNAPIEYICIENPVPNRYAKELIGSYSQSIQPYQFGEYNENCTKRTCLWLKNLPYLEPTMILPPPHKAECHMMSPSKDRAKKRSITYRGIAKAIAEQFFSYIMENR